MVVTVPPLRRSMRGPSPLRVKCHRPGDGSRLGELAFSSLIGSGASAARHAVAQRCEEVTAPVTVGEEARATSQFTPQRPWHTSKRDVDGLCRRHRCCWKSRQQRSTPSRRLQRLRRWTDWPGHERWWRGWSGVFPVEPHGLGSITVTDTSLSPNLIGVYVATVRPTDVQSCKEHLTVGHPGRRIAACWRPLNGHCTAD